MMDSFAMNRINFESSFLKHLKSVLSVYTPKIAETNLENNPEAMNYSTLWGNDNGQCSSSSSVCLPPNFGEFQMIRITSSTV